MKKLLLLIVGVFSIVQLAFATTCPNAIAIPSIPTMPYTQSITCGATDDITSVNVTSICGSANYYGGQEALYMWTPTANYTGVTIDYNGVTWSGIMLYAGCPTSGGTCVGNIQSLNTTKTLTVGNITAGTTYYIMFDTWPSPNSPCPGTFTINGTIVLPATPPTPVQDPTPPTCSAGSQLTVSGTPPAGVQYYWQTSATGTSTTIPYSGPYTVFANGTYYLRAYEAATSQWSASSSSIVVSNFPTSTPPPAAVAAQDPACVTTGTTLSVSAPPAGYTYYWQGMVNGGSSNALNAATPYPVSATGTYYVAAFETATGCWSNTVGTMVTVGTYIPAAPTTSLSNYNICSGTPSLMIDATTPPGGPGGSPVTSFGTNLQSTGIGAATYTITAPVIPAGATITSARLQFTNVNSINGSWRSEIRVATTGIYALAPTQISPLGSGGLISPDPFINLAGFPLTGGTLNLVLTESYDDPGVTDATYGEVTLAITYTQNPVSTLTWYDAATGGNAIGSTSPFETVGTSVLPNTTASGAYNFYAGSTSVGCSSTARTQITVNVTQVLATLTPVNVSCNGGNNGSFTLGTVQCGTPGFLYSVNGGTFGAIPTNLTAGTYSIVMQDAIMGVSAPISVVITQPGVPVALTVNDVNYYSALVSWTSTGNETNYIVEYGPVGFTQGSGTEIPVTDTFALITGLTEDTDYQFFVTVDCGPANNYAGPKLFSTNAGFFTFDNACGPGFTDISGTGTALNLGDDATVTVTSGFPIQFQGITTDQITVSNNGYIYFGAATLNAWNLDLDTEEGNVYHQTLNIGGTNYFVVQWDDRPRYPGIVGQSVTFQILINETTDEIYYVYDDVVFGGTQSGNDYGLAGTISALGPQGSSTVSDYNSTYLTNNSCVHFYNSLCPNPTNIVVDEHEIDADITWTAGLYGETNWTIIYGPTGFDPLTEGDTAVSTTTTVNLFPLTQNTEYDFYLFSECAADGLTSAGVTGTFTTLPFCTTPSALTAQTDIDSLEATWSWTQNINFPGYAIESFSIQYGMTGFELGTGTMYTANGTNNADTVFNTGFLSGGVYQYYLQAVCGTNDSVSSWVGPITFTMPLANDNACLAETIAVDGPVYTFNNTGATSVGEGAIAPPATGAQTTDGWINQTLNGTVWYKFVAPASGSVRVDATGIDYNGQAAVYSVNTCSNFATYNLLAANDNAIGGTSLAPNFTVCGLTAGNTYYLLFDGFNSTTGNYSLELSSINLEAGLANTTPLTLNVCSGTNVELFNTVTGEQTGGVWSSNIPSVNISITGSDLETAGLAYTTYDLQYRVTDGCAYDSVIGKVKIFAPSNAGTDGTITACRNQPVVLLSGLGGNVDLGGTWYTPGGTATTNGAEITSANTQGNYNYTYISGNGVCPNDTALVVVNVLGTCNALSVEEQLFAGVEVFPNPSAGIVFVTSDINFNYEVTDANGRVVTTSQNGVKAAQKTEINLSDVERGVYFIRLNNEDAQKTYRIVIN